ncbi:MAG TPA: tetratricopeptide repeat protein [Myxococcales bacterium]|nr:tetratricopeptide repeat protein [Myxococcales bacterium]
MLRLSHAALIALFAGCAAAPPRPSTEAEELKELRGQLQAQSVLVAQQQRRIEELEVKLAALAGRAAVQDSPAPRPVRAVAPAKEPRPQLRTVKIGGRLRHGDRLNPVERAPVLPSTVALREPDEEALARLDVDPTIAREFGADRAWAEAVEKLNQGKHEEAEADLLAFVAAHPHHTAADNALYLAGLVREARGDCPGALQLFESVPQKYPAGDAVAQALLERGRCLRILGRNDEAKSILNQLSREHPDAPETARAQALLHDL